MPLTLIDICNIICNNTVTMVDIIYQGKPETWNLIRNKESIINYLSSLNMGACKLTNSVIKNDSRIFGTGAYGTVYLVHKHGNMKPFIVKKVKPYPPDTDTFGDYPCKLKKSRSINQSYYDIKSGNIITKEYKVPINSYLCMNNSYNEYILNTLVTEKVYPHCKNFMEMFNIINCDNREFMFSEYNEPSMTVSNFIRRNINNTDYWIKSIIFQILFAITTYQRILPGLSHNDLKLDNIIVNIDQNMNMYKYKNQSFVVGPTYICKIIDWGVSVHWKAKLNDNSEVVVGYPKAVYGQMVKINEVDQMPNEVDQMPDFNQIIADFKLTSPSPTPNPKVIDKDNEILTVPNWYCQNYDVAFFLQTMRVLTTGMKLTKSIKFIEKLMVKLFDNTSIEEIDKIIFKYDLYRPNVKMLPKYKTTAEDFITDKYLFGEFMVAEHHLPDPNKFNNVLLGEIK